MALNLKSMLGFDPTEIQHYVASLAKAAEAMKSEQARIAEFQNLLASHMIQVNERLGSIERRLKGSGLFDDDEKEPLPDEMNNAYEPGLMGNKSDEQ